MKTTRVVFLSLAAVFLIGCQDATDPLDPGISLSEKTQEQLDIETEIVQLFPERGPRNAALRHVRNIHKRLDKGDTEGAQEQGVGLCRFIGEHEQDGPFNGDGDDARNLCALVLELVGVDLDETQAVAAVLVNLSKGDAAGLTVVTDGNCPASVVSTSNSGLSIPEAPCLVVDGNGAPPPSGPAGSQAFTGPSGSLLVVITDCVDIDVDIPLFGTCQDIQAVTPEGSVVEFSPDFPATLAMCELDFASTGLGDQEELLRIHQQDLAEVKALPLGPDLCAEIIGSTGSNGLVRFARGLVNSVRDRVVSLVAPKPLLARAYYRMYRLNRRSSPISGFSQFQWALPSTMTPLPGSNGQTAGPGTPVPVPPGVRVTDELGGDVSGATVTFTVRLGGGTVTPLSVTTGANGIAQVTSWELGPAPPTVPVTNTLEASGRGIAADPAGPFVPVQPDFDPVALETGIVEFTATAENRILVYGPSMLATSDFSPDNEQTFAEDEGFVVTVADSVTWVALTTAEFASFNAIVFGDQGGDVLGAAELSKADWSAAITGPVIISALNPQIHQCDLAQQSCLDESVLVHQSEAITLIKNAINFAASAAGTGAYISLDSHFAGAPANTDVTFLSEIGAFQVAGIVAPDLTSPPNFFNVFSDIIDIVAMTPTHPAMASLTNAGLSGWFASNHQFIQAFPASYTVLAESDRNFGTFETPVLQTLAVIIACSTDCVVPPGSAPASFDVAAGLSSNVSKVKIPKNIR